jgi:hypothetical protein
LDLNGNSVRGILFAKELAKVYHMHIFENVSDIKNNNKNENQQGPGQDEKEQRPAGSSSFHSVKMSKSAISGMNPLKVNHTNNTHTMLTMPMQSESSLKTRRFEDQFDFIFGSHFFLTFYFLFVSIYSCAAQHLRSASTNWYNTHRNLSQNCENCPPV